MNQSIHTVIIIIYKNRTVISPTANLKEKLEIIVKKRIDKLLDRRISTACTTSFGFHYCSFH